MSCFRCQCGMALRLILVLLAALSINTLAEGQGTIKVRDRIVPGESVSPQLSGKILQLLFDGVADLYHQTDGAVNNYYIKDSNGRLFTISVPQKEVEDATWSGLQGAVSVLKVLMQDAPALHSRIESCELDKHKLTGLMHDYHTAVTGSDKGIEYELPPPALIPRLGFFAGYNADFLQPGSTGDLSGIKLDPAFYPTAGISVRTILPRINRNLSITLDLSAGKRYVYGYYNSIRNTQPNSEIYKELHLHNYLIMSDLLIGYNFGSGIIKPFVSGGICTRTVVSDESRLETDTYYQDLVIYSDNDDYSTDETTGLGVMISMGLSFDIPKKISLSTAINYSELIVSPAFWKYRSAGLTLGIKF